MVPDKVPCFTSLVFLDIRLIIVITFFIFHWLIKCSCNIVQYCACTNDFRKIDQYCGSMAWQHPMIAIFSADPKFASNLRTTTTTWNKECILECFSGCILTSECRRWNRLFHLPKVCSIITLVFLWDRLNALWLAVAGSWYGVIRYGFNA